MREQLISHFGDQIRAYSSLLIPLFNPRFSAPRLICALTFDKCLIFPIPLEANLILSRDSQVMQFQERHNQWQCWIHVKMSKMSVLVFSIAPGTRMEAFHDLQAGMISLLSESGMLCNWAELGQVTFIHSVIPETNLMGHFAQSVPLKCE